MELRVAAVEKYRRRDTMIHSREDRKRRRLRVRWLLLLGKMSMQTSLARCYASLPTKLISLESRTSAESNFHLGIMAVHRVHCASAGISSARWVIGSGRAEHLAEAWCVHPRPFNAIFFRDPPPPPSPLARRG